MGQMIWEDFCKGNPRHPLTVLKMKDMERLAAAAISGWIVARAGQAQTYGEDVEAMIKEALGPI